MNDLSRTDHFLAGLLGVVEAGEPTVVRTPHNPGYYHGNFVRYRALPPLDEAVTAFEAAFAGAPDIQHQCICWDDAPLSPEVRAAALAAGFESDDGIALAMDRPPPAPSSQLVVRPRTAAEWSQVAAANAAWDPAETDDEDYRRFKRTLFATYGRWVELGHATWWGVFDGETLAGQCGFVPCGELGRFQSVETHPDYRRRGVATALVSTVARHAFGSLGVRRVLLAAEPDGPAVGLYQRLGFREIGRQHALVRAERRSVLREERPGDRAGVRSLVTAAFGRPQEAELVDALRDVPGVHALVIERSGRLLGHALFTPVTVEGPEGPWDAIALGPVAVRPELQRQGIGTELLRGALDRLGDAHPICFVLGHASYYARFGFRPAAPLGLRCAWDAPPDAFMVREHRPGALAGRAGLVRYLPAFDRV